MLLCTTVHRNVTLRTCRIGAFPQHRRGGVQSCLRQAHLRFPSALFRSFLFNKLPATKRAETAHSTKYNMCFAAEQMMTIPFPIALGEREERCIGCERPSLSWSAKTDENPPVWLCEAVSTDSKFRFEVALQRRRAGILCFASLRTRPSDKNPRYDTGPSLRSDIHTLRSHLNAS